MNLYIVLFPFDMKTFHIPLTIYFRGCLVTALTHVDEFILCTPNRALWYLYILKFYSHPLGLKYYRLRKIHFSGGS